MSVTLIAAVASNGVIGAGGGLPWHLPGDLKRFRETTMGHPLVMGRRTYDSIGRPLPGRTTIVITRQRDWQVESVLTASSIDEALSRAAEIDHEVFVAGGGQVYAATMPVADRLLVTWVDAEPPGDTYFPRISELEWDEVQRDQHDGWALATYHRR